VSGSAWGIDVYGMITCRAIEGLPAELKPFYMAKVDFISEHSVDPDLWITPDLRGRLGNEAPNHFLDYDGFKDPFPFTNVPREWDAVVQKYGAELANRNGRVPWRAEEIFNKPVEQFTRMQRPKLGSPVPLASRCSCRGSSPLPRGLVQSSPGVSLGDAEPIAQRAGPVRRVSLAHRACPPHVPAWLRP